MGPLWQQIQVIDYRELQEWLDLKLLRQPRQASRVLRRLVQRMPQSPPKAEVRWPRHFGRLLPSSND